MTEILRTVFMNAIVELYCAAQEVVRNPGCVCGVPSCNMEKRRKSAWVRLEAALKACDATGDMMAITEHFNQGEMKES